MHVQDCRISCAGQKCRMSLQDWNNKHAGQKLLDGITALYQYTCLTKKTVESHGKIINMLDKN